MQKNYVKLAPLKCRCIQWGVAVSVLIVITSSMCLFTFELAQIGANQPNQASSVHCVQSRCCQQQGYTLKTSGHLPKLACKFLAFEVTLILFHISVYKLLLQRKVFPTLVFQQFPSYITSSV